MNESIPQPNMVKLADGSYIQWDKQDGYYRVAFYAKQKGPGDYYERRTQKGSDLKMTIAQAMKRPIHNSRVVKIFEYISGTDVYAASCS